MAQIETWLRTDLQQIVRVQELDGNLFTADNGANLIGVIVTNKGKAVNLTGGVNAYIIRPDEETVVVSGSVSGNRASVILPSSAYVKTGPVHIVIKNGNTTIGACSGFVRRSTTDTIVDPGHVIPSLSDLLAEIGNMRSATAAANSAASSANTAAGTANTAATNANNKASAANTAAGAANSAAGTANTAAANADTAATKLNDMTIVVTQGDPSLPPSASMDLVNGHYRITLTNVKGARGETGEAFHVKKTYASVAAMNADYSGTDVNVGEYVMVVSNVEDPDNASVYIKGSDAWHFVVDMSGAKGIKGDTGNGILSASFADYCLTLTFTNGDVFVTPSLRGEQGIQGNPGNDGYSPTVDVTNITGGHRVTVTDSSGSDSFDVMDGADGQDGQNGQDGQDGNDGYSPTVEITSITGGHRVTVTDATGSSSFDVMDGADGQDGNDGEDGSDGQDGYSPTVAVTDITGGHRVTVTDANGSTSFDVMDGADGQDGSDGDDGQNGYSPTITITNITGGHRVTVTDVTGSTFFDVMDGIIENIYATNIPMSSSDNTPISDVLNGKAGKVANATNGNFAGLNGSGELIDSGKKASDFVSSDQGSANAGKALGIGNDGLVTPVPFSGEDFTGATALSNGVHGYVPAPNAGDQTKFLQAGGGWASVPMPPTMVGASASMPGVPGLVPAPSAGGNVLFLCGDATWKVPPGSKWIFRDLDTVTNTSGSYSHTTIIQDVAADMKPVLLELSNPSAFKGTVTVTPADGSVTLTCSSVSGTSTVKVGFVFEANASAITSSEFDILDNRIQAIENVCADTDVTIATTDWTLANGVYSYVWSNALVAANSLVEILLRDGAESAGIADLEYTKSTGSVTIVTEDTPTASLPITIRIIHTKLNGLQELDATQIASEAVTGCDTVEEALTAINEHMAKNKQDSAIDISSYTTGNSYTVPNDAYLYTSITAGFVYVAGSDGVVIGSISGTTLTFLRKGMICYCSNITGSAYIKTLKS